MTYAKHFLVLTKHKDLDVSSFTAQGYIPIVRDLPEQEGDMKSLGVCAANFVGFTLNEPSRMPTLNEYLYIIARIRKIKL